MSNKDGGPAFPTEENVEYFSSPSSTRYETGMTLRDYFAAKAMQGMIAAGCTVDIAGEHLFQQRAGACYAIADAMIAERKT